MNPENVPSGEALKKYCRDLTQMAKDGKLDPVIGRDSEMRRTIEILSRRTKNNPILLGEPGVGKCWGRGTQLMMYDGSLKRVEDIVRDSQLGLPQLLMGDDSTPRRVIPESAIAGKGDMYRITSRNDGRTVWTCNADHILVLKLNQKPVLYKQRGRWYISSYELVNGSDHTAHQPSQYPAQRHLAGPWDDAQAKQAYDEMLKNWRPLEFECTLRDYLTIKSETIRSMCMMFQPAVVDFPPPRADRRLASVLAFCVGVDGFVSDDLVAETAWVLGMWAANGHDKRPYIARIGCQIPNQSHLPVVDRILRWIKRVLPHESEAEIRARVKTHKSRTLGNVGYAVDCGPVLHRLLEVYNMIGNKHLPLELLTESAVIRKAMLEGIIDGKGQLRQLTTIQLQTNDRRMVDDCTHLARGLGFSVGRICKYHQVNKKTGTETTTWHLNIAGAKLPTLLPELQYKRCSHVNPIKDQLCDGFDVECMGVDEYFGFALDGNGRCLLGEFIVTHSTAIVEGRTPTHPQQ